MHSFDELRALQRRWGAAVRASDAAADDLEISASAGRLERGAGLRLYRSGIQARWRETLEAIFPVSALLVGTEFFGAMARAYLVDTPPRRVDIARIGEGFAGFVARFEPAEVVPYLAEVAELEHAVHVAEGSARLEPGDPAELGEAEGLELAPSATLLDPVYAVLPIWAMHLDDVSFVAPTDGPARPLLVWRASSGSVRVEPLEDDEHRLLASFHEGCAIDDLLSRPDLHVLGASLGLWLAEGRIVFAARRRSG